MGDDKKIVIPNEHFSINFAFPVPFQALPIRTSSLFCIPNEGCNAHSLYLYSNTIRNLKANDKSLKID